MTTQLNTYEAVSSLAQNIQEDAVFIVRETGIMQSLVQTFTDARGMNPRVGYQYGQGTAKSIGESDDLTSDAFEPEADQTLTPAEIGEQFFITDARIDSQLPESIRNDGAMELGLAAADKVESDLISDMADLTGGTIGASGTAITWGYLAAAIAQARYVNKSNAIPLVAIIHGYQWSVLAKAASVAGSSLSQAPGVTEEITRTGFVATFMGVRVYQVQAEPTSNNFTGGVFPKSAIAIDWRRPIRVEAERDASRRGWELNMSAIYAHGVWRPKLGIQMTFAATAPTS